jgi:hypothetical protein
MEQSGITYKCEFNPSKPGSCMQIKGQRRTEPRPVTNFYVFSFIYLNKIIVYYYKVVFFENRLKICNGAGPTHYKLPE